MGRSPAIRWVLPSTTAASPRRPATWPGSGRCSSTTAGSGAAGWFRGPGWAPPSPPHPGVRDAFAVTGNEFVLPGGWYRNQFWVLPGPGGPVLVCLGIHGQLVYADRAPRTVVVKLSCWPEAQNTAYLLDTLRACAALTAGLSAGGL